MDIHEILKQYWGFDHFRPFQADIINAVLEGNDTLALLPTGGGKSICFQVPALAREGLCVVVSPLIALMKDQVENLKKRGIPALALYSGMNFIELKKNLQNAAYGNFKFLYVSPERLETKLFLEYLPALPVNLLAVDEAHCISQWGYDFRPPYTRIASIRQQLPNVPVLALTASATKTVQDDICEKLLFTAKQHRFQQSFERPNLSYSVFNVPSRQHKLMEILKNVPGSSIIYCRSRRNTKEIADWLKLHSIPADHYHAGLKNEERSDKQEAWINGKSRVIVCTNAFGMGIDKTDVRSVIHFDIPDCLENYYQEAGRAGRDGKRAYAVLLYGSKEPVDLLLQIGIRYPSQEYLKRVYTDLMNHLQIPAGTGEGMAFDFDLTVFTDAFKLNILQGSYAVRALEQEGILSFNEVFFKPSTVVFTTDRDELSEFENREPELEPVIKGLLRSYEGIFDYPATVYESQLGKFIQMGTDDLKKALKKLNDHNLIIYTPQKDKPQVTLLQNRMYADNYSIDTTAYLKRKENFEIRISTIIAYIKNTTGCRSQIIADYFNSARIKPCGICDNCINEKTGQASVEEFEKISGQIHFMIKEGPFSIEQLIHSMKEISKEKIWAVVSYLQAEKKIQADGEGFITLL